MTDTEILTKLRRAMKQSAPGKADWDAVSTATTFESLGFDSLTVLDLLYDIQHEFGIEFEADDLAGITTVSQLVGFLKGKAV